MQRRERVAYIKPVLPPARVSQKKKVDKIINDLCDTKDNHDDDSKYSPYVYSDNASDDEHHRSSNLKTTGLSNIIQ